MDPLIQDIRYALRGLRRSPGFAVVAALTLALGVGVNATIFSMVNAALLRPLPVARPGELIDVYRQGPSASGHDSSSYLDYLDLRNQTEALDGLMAYTNFFGYMSRESRTELVIGEIVSDNYFDVLGVRPVLGRSFVPEEFEGELAHPVAILSYPFWQSRFGGDPAAVGGSARINGTPYTIVGVAPASFHGMFPAVTPQMWIPVAMVGEVEPIGNQTTVRSPTGDTRLTRRGTRWLWMRGRLREGATPRQAEAELEGIMARLAEQYPETNDRQTIAVVPTSQVRFNPDFDVYLAPAAMLITTAVGLVLLVACANIANLLLARGATRRKEIAVRLALGAGRLRLVRQLLTESLLLALAGGVLGLAAASFCTRLIAAVQPPLGIDLGVDFGVDARVLAFTLLVSLITGVVFGLVPALRGSRPALVPALKDADAGGGRRSRLELRDALVVLQVAVSMVLLVGGALMIRSLSFARASEVGFDAEHTSYYALALGMFGYDDASAQTFFETARARLLEEPGVEAVTVTSRAPMSINDNNFAVYLDGYQASADDEPFVIPGTYGDPRYFDTFGVRLLEGRGFEEADGLERRRVAIATKALAERFWPGENAVGKQFRLEFDAPPYRIVGIVEDYKTRTVGEPPTPYLHFPFPMGRETFAVFVVRTRDAARAHVPELQRVFLSIDPELAFMQTGPMRDMVETTLFPVRLGAILIGTFAALALLLAGVGLYGVIGYAVSRRTREIGIRVALGADRRRVLLLVVAQGMALVGTGVVLGALVAAFTGGILSSALYGISATDPVAFGAAIVALVLIGVAANALPARRAVRVDPMVALRRE